VELKFNIGKIKKLEIKGFWLFGMVTLFPPSSSPCLPQRINALTERYWDIVLGAIHATVYRLCCSSGAKI
jgi:hypothetical protein